VTITAGRGDFHRPSRPGQVAHLGHPPTPKVSSGSLAGGWSHFGCLQEALAVSFFSFAP
jgi:hypothetical protein